MYILRFIMYFMGIPRWLSGKESACQCRKYGFNPCIRKDPWRRKWQPAPVSLPEKFTDRETATVHGVVESVMTVHAGSVSY